MIIKKFQALNEQDAIILAKEELGKNFPIAKSAGRKKFRFDIN